MFYQSANDAIILEDFL